MNAPNDEDRRRDPRTQVRLDVLWSTDDLVANGGASDAVVTDLSHGGARLMCARYLPEFTRVSLTFRSGERSFTCQGLVAWCSRKPPQSPASFIAGIEFQGVDKTLRDRLSKLIDPSDSSG